MKTLDLDWTRTQRLNAELIINYSGFNWFTTKSSKKALHIMLLLLIILGAVTYFHWPLFDYLYIIICF
jgi:hypothetical protein